MHTKYEVSMSNPVAWGCAQMPSTPKQDNNDDNTQNMIA